MLTVRVHLDGATRDNGCLKVIPGSHRLGFYPPSRFKPAVAQHQLLCGVRQRRAQLWVMRRCLSYASSKGSAPSSGGCCIWSLAIGRCQRGLNGVEARN